MCLTLKKNPKIERAKKSITVYKVLRENVLHGFRAPYRGTPYKRGDLKKAKRFTNGWGFSFFKDIPRASCEIHRGLHTYGSLSIAKRWCSGVYRRVIVECKIPRGTLFIRGKYGEVVSLKLKVGKAVWASYGKHARIKKFNSRG